MRTYGGGSHLAQNGIGDLGHLSLPIAGRAGDLPGRGTACAWDLSTGTALPARDPVVDLRGGLDHPDIGAATTEHGGGCTQCGYRVHRPAIGAGDGLGLRDRLVDLPLATTATTRLTSAAMACRTGVFPGSGTVVALSLIHI